MNFVHIPRSIIEDTSLSRNRLLYFIYLSIHKGASSYIGYSIKDIMQWARITPNSCKGGSTSRVKEEISFFIQSIQGQNENCFDYSKTNIFNKAYLPPSVFISDNGFAMITMDEVDKILDLSCLYNRDSSYMISAADLFSVLAYLRVNTSRRSAQDSQINECCFRYYKTIANDLDIPERNISGLIKTLVDMGIIVCVDGPTRKFPDGNIRTSCKYFADAYRYRKNAAGEYILDEEYSPYTEIERQIKKK